MILFADDLGYGDLGCYGHPTIKTPNLDRMAGEGMKLTQFYAAAPFCTPSRAALLTGRYPLRSGLTRTLFPKSSGGIQDGELTLAEALKSRGYSTACIGKWHLGHLPPYLPTRHGFDRFFGLPYSNDMDSEDRNEPPIPLMRDEKVIEVPVDKATLTQRYTREAISFIKDRRHGGAEQSPFFLYLPYSMPHIPLITIEKFEGASARGIYGDVVEEIDWSVGEILKTLKDEGLARNTLVIFTSDNGPLLELGLDGGSAGLLRGGKDTTWEGGMRVPCIAWWPGKIRAGAVSREIASTMGLFTTCLKLAGAEIPGDRIIDGKSLLPILFETGKSELETFFYYRDFELMAVRKGPWKMHLRIKPEGQGGYVDLEAPLLFHLDRDPSEKHDAASDHPDVIADLAKEIESHRQTMTPGEIQW